MAELYNFPKDHSSELQYSIEVTEDEVDTISIDGVNPNSNITIYLDGLLLVKNVHYTINIGEIVLSNYKARKGSIFTIRLGSESLTENSCIASSIPIKEDEKFGNAASVEGALDYIALLISQRFSSLATVATSGSYNDLSNKPTIPDISGKLDKSGGTLTGDVIAASSTATNTRVIRNIIIGTSDPSSSLGSNGDIYIKYS